MSTCLASTHLALMSSFPQFRLLGQFRVEKFLTSFPSRSAAQVWALIQAWVTGTQAPAAAVAVGLAVGVGLLPGLFVAVAVGLAVGADDVFVPVDDADAGGCGVVPSSDFSASLRMPSMVNIPSNNPVAMTSSRFRFWLLKPSQNRSFRVSGRCRARCSAASCAARSLASRASRVACCSARRASAAACSASSRAFSRRAESLSPLGTFPAETWVLPAGCGSGALTVAGVEGAEGGVDGKGGGPAGTGVGMGACGAGTGAGAGNGFAGAATGAGVGVTGSGGGPFGPDPVDPFDVDPDGAGVGAEAVAVAALAAALAAAAARPPVNGGGAGVGPMGPWGSDISCLLG